MSDLQQTAKPILVPFLKGEWPDIYAENAAIIAAWVAMTTMVIETADPLTRATSDDQRREFRERKAPPSGWQIFVGRYKGEDYFGFNHFGWSHQPQIAIFDERETPVTAAQECQSTFFTIGSLAVLACSTRAPLNYYPQANAVEAGMQQFYPFIKLVAENELTSCYETDIDRLSQLFIPQRLRATARPYWNTYTPLRNDEVFHILKF